jgi:hypothetical protein
LEVFYRRISVVQVHSCQDLAHMVLDGHLGQSQLRCYLFLTETLCNQVGEI